jgi:hypothetical protein
VASSQSQRGKTGFLTKGHGFSRVLHVVLNTAKDLLCTLSLISAAGEKLQQAVVGEAFAQQP